MICAWCADMLHESQAQHVIGPRGLVPLGVERTPERVPGRCVRAMMHAECVEPWRLHASTTQDPRRGA